VQRALLGHGAVREIHGMRDMLSVVCFRGTRINDHHILLFLQSQEQIPRINLESKLGLIEIDLIIHRFALFTHISELDRLFVEGNRQILSTSACSGIMQCKQRKNAGILQKAINGDSVLVPA
jgi:hypothetical protein